MVSALSSSLHAAQLASSYNAPSCSYNRSPSLPSALTSTSENKSLAHHSPSEAMMASRPFVASPRQVFRVYGYGPHEGMAGACIVVNLQFHLVSRETVFLRIVVGNRALATDVRPTQSKREGEWDLRAVIPDFDALAMDGLSSSPTVPVTVQALNASNSTIDSLTFGNFTYCFHYAVPVPSPFSDRETSEMNGSSPSSTSADPMLSRRRSRPSSAGAVRSRSINSPAGSRDSSARGQLKKQSLIRARRSSTDDDDAESAFRASLVMETPTDSLADVQEWDVEERRAGRRLVRFSRVQEGCTLRVVCEPIRASAYKDGETVVSCILRPPDWGSSGEPPVSQCCITSVDIIFLLECLVGDVFNIEEKNRIRRNLEGFRPKTVSKNKAGSEEFFQKIMDFPAPKPRNIEKDVKVFDWAVLAQALDKIISKYTLLPAVLKQDGAATPPASMRNTPQLSHASATASYTVSPPPDHTSNSPYISYQQQPAYNAPYVPSVQDRADSSFSSGTIIPGSDLYDSYMAQAQAQSRIRSHAHASAHSLSPSPTPLLSTPADSPLVPNLMSLSYSETSSLYHAPPSVYSGTYGHSSYAPPVYDPSGYRRTKLSDTPSSQAYA